MMGQHAHEHAAAQAKPLQAAIPRTDGVIIKVDAAA